MAQMKSTPPNFGSKQAVQVSETQAELRRQKLTPDTEWWEQPGGVRLTLYNFEPLRWDLKLGHRVILEDAAKYLKVGSERRVWILGNAEMHEGPPMRKQTLSLQRAEAVKQVLFGHGIQATQLLSAFQGGVKGCSDTLSEAQWNNIGYDPQKFRSVEVLLLNMMVQQILADHMASLRAEGYTL